MPPKYATQEQLKELQKDVDEIKGIVFDIKDNHIKHMGECIASVKGTQKVILILLSAILGSGLIGGIVTLLIQ